MAASRDSLSKDLLNKDAFNNDGLNKDALSKDGFWNDRRTIVAAFDSRWHADQAIHDLREAGFRNEELAVTPDQPDRPAFKGLDQSLMNMGVPRNEALGYEREFQQGATLVTVTADANKPLACEILRRHGGFGRKMDFGPVVHAHTQSALRERAAACLRFRAEERPAHENGSEAGERKGE